MLISYEKPLRSRTKQGISLLLVSPPLNRIQQVTMGNEFDIEFHGKPGKLSWKPFRARCRMAQRANGTRSACRKLFSWHSSAPKSFPLVFLFGLSPWSCLHPLLSLLLLGLRCKVQQSARPLFCALWHFNPFTPEICFHIFTYTYPCPLSYLSLPVFLPGNN